MTEFENGNDKAYKMERIWDITIYTKELIAGHLPGLYYLKS